MEDKAFKLNVKRINDILEGMARGRKLNISKKRLFNLVEASRW